jgi:hypothetical protein
MCFALSVVDPFDGWLVGSLPCVLGLEVVVPGHGVGRRHNVARFLWHQEKAPWELSVRQAQQPLFLGLTGEMVRYTYLGT